jgi:hypothetical protein
MTDIQIGPLAGIDTEDDDAALQIGGDAPRLYVRDAVNLDISDDGRARLRPGLRRVSSLQLDNLWHSELFGDTFATQGRDWVRVDTQSWTTQTLATIGDNPVSHIALNGQVIVAGPEGLFTFDGGSAYRFTLDTPPSPMVQVTQEGSLEPGTYGVAVAWLRGETESAVSEAAFITLGETGGFSITFPYSFDANVTHVRTYLTRQNGGELARGEDYPIKTLQVSLPQLPAAGAAAQFRHLEPMPTGRYLAYWRGRLLTATRNILNFSEALAYHLRDARHGFIQMPQRITFVAPVDGGIWVGQADHVIFLAGNSPDALEMQPRKARPPVPGSAILVDAQIAGADASQGGQATALWLAENGFVMGTAVGTLVETSGRRLADITGASGKNVVFGDRVVCA